jgi:integrase
MLLHQANSAFADLGCKKRFDFLFMAPSSQSLEPPQKLTRFTCIGKDFIPYFADRQLEVLIHSDIVEFELCQDRQMAKLPKASTLNNFASAWSRLCSVAIPKLSTRGLKSIARPAFSRLEIKHLLAYMVESNAKGGLALEREILLLQRDHLEMLLLTGMRYGTEALGISWKHIEWHTDKDIRYLRTWVNGKTVGRRLIAKHRAVDVFTRLHSRQ